MESETNNPSFPKCFENIFEKVSWPNQFSFITNPLVGFTPTSKPIAQPFHDQSNSKGPN